MYGLFLQFLFLWRIHYVFLWAWRDVKRQVIQRVNILVDPLEHLGPVFWCSQYHRVVFTWTVQCLQRSQGSVIFAQILDGEHLSPRVQPCCAAAWVLNTAGEMKENVPVLPWVSSSALRQGAKHPKVLVTADEALHLIDFWVRYSAARLSHSAPAFATKT